MPVDQNLVARVRNSLNSYPGCIEKRMFGGVGYILNGNMACGVQGSDLIVRVGVENNEFALSRPFVKPFMGVPGKPMAGWVLVMPEGTTTDGELQYWVGMGYECAARLPKKE